MLVDAGIIDEIQLTVALGAQNDTGLRLGRQLLKLGFVEERDLAMFLKEDTDLGIPLPKRNISREALKAVPEALAFKHRVVPLAIVGKTLVLAIPDPKDIKTIDELSLVLGKKIQPVRAFEWEIESALLKFYKHFTDEELETLTSMSSAGEQYHKATWAFGSEVLLDKTMADLNGKETAAQTSPKRRAVEPTKATSPPVTMKAPTRPAQQQPHVNRPQPGVRQAAAEAPASKKEKEEFIVEHTSQTEKDTTRSAMRASRALSDTIVNMKNADILQAIIDLLMDKKVITEKELIDRLIKLDEDLKK